MLFVHRNLVDGIDTNILASSFWPSTRIFENFLIIFWAIDIHVRRLRGTFRQDCILPQLDLDSLQCVDIQRVILGRITGVLIPRKPSSMAFRTPAF